MTSVSKSLNRQWSAIGLLTIVGVLNIVDRFLPAVLAQPIKEDLALSDTALGLINGFGFLLIYALVGIPIARLSDRGRYGLVIGVCVGAWSAMTALGGLAQAGWQLALTRMGVAAGEAGSTPAAHAYISRNFPPDRRAAPLALLTLSVPIASVIGLMAGGLIGDILGWRQTFFLMGSVGLILCPLVILTLGRRDVPAEPVQPQGQLQSGSTSLFAKTSFNLILAGSAFIAVGGYALTSFAPAFLMRQHGLTLTEVGVFYGPVAGGLAAVGLCLTGWLADRMSNRDPRWLLRVVALMILALLPFSSLAFFLEGMWPTIIFVALANVVSTAYMAPVVSALQRLAAPNLRATASALMLFFSAVAGGVGPLAAGAISDGLTPTLGAGALAYALLLVPVAHAIAALLYWASTATFRGDMDPTEGRHPLDTGLGVAR